MASRWAWDPFSRTKSGADVRFSPFRLQRQNLPEFEPEASHLQTAMQSSGGRDLGSLTSSMLSWLERPQGCHWGLTTLRDGVSSSPVPAAPKLFTHAGKFLKHEPMLFFLLFIFLSWLLPWSRWPKGRAVTEEGRERGSLFLASAVQKPPLSEAWKDLQALVCVRAGFPEPPPHPQTRKGLPGQLGGTE